MELDKKDIDTVIARYSQRYKEFGYSPKTLGWDKGKQDLRFGILTSQFPIAGKSIMDIGCGFGDLNKYLINKHIINYSYSGIDIVPDLINEATARYAQKNITFQCGDFLNENIEDEFDYAIGSGIFNFKLENDDNYAYIHNVIAKAFSLCKIGVAFDFLSDKVDFTYAHTHHSSPEKIVSMGYEFTRNLILRNDYMPFEFTLILFKDDSFQKEDTIFTRFKNNI